MHTLSPDEPAEPTKRALAEPSRRLDAVPAYMFAELERRVAEKRENGIDVISLGIGDPDRPTYPHVVEAMQAAVADPANQHYPSNRGRAELREAFADFYADRFGVEIDVETEVIPAIGAKECIYNLCFAFLDPGDVALAADPGYPVYTGGPRSPGPSRCCWRFARARVRPRPRRDRERRPGPSRRLLFVNYPNNPTGAVVPGRLLRAPGRTGARTRGVDRSRQRLLGDHLRRYVAPSFLATPGAKEVGVEVFSLSKGFNMTGWRCAAILGNPEAIESYWRLKTNVDSGLFEAVQLAGAAALAGPRAPIEEMNAIYARRRDLVVGALREIGVRVDAPKGRSTSGPPSPKATRRQSFAELVLEEAAVVVSPGSMYGPSGEGFFRISLTTPDDRISEAVEPDARAPRMTPVSRGWLPAPSSALRKLAFRSVH